MHTACLTITGPRCHVIKQALEQETAPQAGILLKEGDTQLDIVIKADTAAHLRAACNSFLGWVDLVERIADAFDGQSPVAQ